MFAATRSLAGLKKSMPIVVHDKNNAAIGTDIGKAFEVKNVLSRQLKEDVNNGISAFVLARRSLLTTLSLKVKFSYLPGSSSPAGLVVPTTFITHC